jgi:chromosome partitioning protein
VAHKGGVGKTTVAVNLGGAYAALGQRVLLVDCDPQGSLADALGLAPATPTLLEVLAGEAPAAAAARPTVVPRLALLPAGDDLTDMEDRLYSRAGWHLALRHALRPLPEYDVVVIDTPPGLGMLSFMGILGADSVLVLCPPEFLAQRALPKVLATVERARRSAPDLALAGILPTLVGGRSRSSRRSTARWCCRRCRGGRCFRTPPAPACRLLPMRRAARRRQRSRRWRGRSGSKPGVRRHLRPRPTPRPTRDPVALHSRGPPMERDWSVRQVHTPRRGDTRRTGTQRQGAPEGAPRAFQ